MLVFISVKPTSSYAVVFQSQKRVQYYLPALEIDCISGVAGTTWHINKDSLEHIQKTLQINKGLVQQQIA